MLTQSEPVYYVTSGPKYGWLTKRDDVTRAHRKSRDASRRGGRRNRKRKTQPPKYVTDATLTFTHDDVARGNVIYDPLPPRTGSSADAFTFVLTARNTQPVSDSVVIEIVPADYDGSMKASPAVTSSSTAAPEVVQPASTSEDDGVNKIVVIIVIIASLLLLALVGFAIFCCVRSRSAARRRKLELAAAIDGSGMAPVTSSSSVDQQGGGGGGSGGSDDGRGFPRPPTTARRGAPPPPSLPVIIEPSSTDSGGERSPTASTSAAVIPNYPPPSASGTPRTGYVRVLPPSPPTSPAGARLQRNGAPPRSPSDGSQGPRSVWKEQVTFDWEHVDPELLQHCRKTNPVLHKNQYWV